ncbi:MAG: hypothetical protein V1911_00420, partial [Candidatus Micrarchaeota archaeon]
MNIYESKNYKLLLLIPVSLLIVALLFIPQVKFGMDLKGGMLISAPVSNDFDADQLEQQISDNFEIEELNVRKTAGVTPGIYIEF